MNCLFANGDVFIRFNGKDDNVILEFLLSDYDVPVEILDLVSQSASISQYQRRLPHDLCHRSKVFPASGQ